MAKSPYKFFTPLNRRRHELIEKKYSKGLSALENREFLMLQEVCGEMAGWDVDLLGKVTRDMDKMGLMRRCGECVGTGKVNIEPGVVK